MTATLAIPRAAIPDEPRERRLLAAWRDPEISLADLRERGFGTADFSRMRAAHGKKVQAAALPEFGTVRDRSQRPRRLVFKRAAR